MNNYTSLAPELSLWMVLKYPAASTVNSVGQRLFVRLAPKQVWFTFKGVCMGSFFLSSVMTMSLERRPNSC